MTKSDVVINRLARTGARGKRSQSNFEDGTGTIVNGTLWIKFNYTWTEPTAEEIDYTRKGLSSKITRR